MKINEAIKCPDFPCTDTDRNAYIVPDRDVDIDKVKIVMITEAPPNDLSDYFYADGEPFYLQTTLQAFRDAGTDVDSMKDILDMGVYITTAIKCGKTGYSIANDTTKNCSKLLEQEMALFTNARVIMLMGDVAKRGLNYIARRRGESRVIPSGSTYKIRTQAFFYRTSRVFPSYLQAGPSFFIEKSKRRMIAEDIHTALSLITP